MDKSSLLGFAFLLSMFGVVLYLVATVASTPATMGDDRTVVYHVHHGPKNVVLL